MKYTLERVTTEEVEVECCPFCKSENVTVIYIPGSYGYIDPQAYVTCHRCGATGPKSFNGSKECMETEAINKWNKRG